MTYWKRKSLTINAWANSTTGRRQGQDAGRRGPDAAAHHQPRATAAADHAGEGRVARADQGDQQTELSQARHGVFSARAEETAGAAAATAWALYLLAQRVMILSPRNSVAPSSRPSTTTSMDSARLSGTATEHATGKLPPLPASQETGLTPVCRNVERSGNNPAADADAMTGNPGPAREALLRREVVLPTGGRADKGHVAGHARHDQRGNRQLPSRGHHGHSFSAGPGWP